MARRYIVTRPAGHAGLLSQALRRIGIDAVEIPTVAIIPPESWDPLDGALRRLLEYDWILLTSRSGVEALFERAGRTAVWPPALRWAAIGPGTAAALRAGGITTVWIPSRFLGEAVAREMPVSRGDRVLRVRAAEASEIPSEGLRARGAEVTDVIAYRTQFPLMATGSRLAHVLAEGVEGVIFTSASTVRGFLHLVDAAGLRGSVATIRLIAIGPVTTAAIRAEGLVPYAVASEHSVQGIVDVLAGRDDLEGSDHRAASVRET
ncbi:MAG TPA: uroporphyrinogen-III synthase [bacterium]